MKYMVDCHYDYRQLMGFIRNYFDVDIAVRNCLFSNAEAFGYPTVSSIDGAVIIPARHHMPVNVVDVGKRWLNVESVEVLRAKDLPKELYDIHLVPDKVVSVFRFKSQTRPGFHPLS